MPKLLLDASIIIAWCELSTSLIFDGLIECGFEMIIPKTVAGEIKSSSELTKHIFENSEIMACDEKRYQSLSDRYFRLGSGEIGVLSLGEELEKEGEEYYCVLDDKHSRKTCKKLGLKLKGTIGLCKVLLEEGILTLKKADEIIEKMKEKGTRLPENHIKLLKNEAPPW